MGEALRILILSFSGFAIGGAVSLLFLPGARGLKGSDALERLALDAARIGFAIMVGLISEAIYRAGKLPPNDIRVWLYLVGSILAGTGYIVLAVRGFIRRSRGETSRRTARDAANGGVRVDGVSD